MKKEKKAPIPGEGWYVYKNISGGDLILQNGRMIPKDGTIQGDSSLQKLNRELRLIDNLSKNFKVNRNQKPQLLTEQPLSPVEIITDTVIEEPRRRGEVDITKKELTEFAELKGVKIFPHYGKDKIMEKIREKSKTPITEQNDQSALNNILNG